MNGMTTRARDSFAICIAHREPNGNVVIDLLRERRPRFVPAAVVKEYAEILKLYRVTSVTGDRYSSGWNADEWARAGLRYQPSKESKSELYLSALPMFLSGQVRLVDSEKLRQQFVGLERRVHSNGRESVDDSGAASANDDLSNVCSGAMVLAASVVPMKFAPPIVITTPRPDVIFADPGSAPHLAGGPEYQ